VTDGDPSEHVLTGPVASGLRADPVAARDCCASGRRLRSPTRRYSRPADAVQPFASAGARRWLHRRPQPSAGRAYAGTTAATMPALAARARGGT